MKNIRSNSVFQGRHKLLKSPECKNYIQHSENFQGKFRFPGQAQVAQKSLKIKHISRQWKNSGQLCFSGQAQVVRNSEW